MRFDRNSRRWRSQAGLTIGEIIVFILIAGISYITLIQIFTFADEKGMEGEVRTIMTNLALERMEIVRSKNYDEKDAPPWSSSLGPDTGESTEAQFDDADDFQGYTETGMNGFTGYTRKTRVFYVDRTVNVEDSVGTATDIKRIIVTVYLPGYDPITLNSIISSRYNVLSY